ncbi:hypothetical protein Tco_0474111 [Tanacetum coccineum]
MLIRRGNVQLMMRLTILDDQQFIVHGTSIHALAYEFRGTVLRQRKFLSLTNKTAFEKEMKRIALERKECVDCTFTLSGSCSDYIKLDPYHCVTSTPTIRIPSFHPQVQIIGKSMPGSNKKKA